MFNNYKGYKISKLTCTANTFHCVAEHDYLDPLKFSSQKYEDLELIFHDVVDEYMNYLAYNRYADEMADYLNETYLSES